MRLSESVSTTGTIMVVVVALEATLDTDIALVKSSCIELRVHLRDHRSHNTNQNQNHN